MSKNQELEELTYRLTKLRGALAHSKQIPPYQVFGDREMVLLLENKPKTIEELSQLKGFPKDGYRVTKLGEAIIKVFTESFDKDLKFDVKVQGEDYEITTSSLPKSSAFSK